MRRPQRAAPRAVDGFIGRCEGASSKVSLKRAIAPTGRPLPCGLLSRARTGCREVSDGGGLCRRDLPHHCPGTLKQRLSPIGFAYSYSDLLSPLVASFVTLAIRRAQRGIPSWPA
jgi:hypothetical protein